MSNRQRGRARKHLRQMKERGLVCQHPGCRRDDPMECHLSIADAGGARDFYCWSHAVDHGFCAGCGVFIAGIDDFSIYCEHCRDEIKADNFPEYDDDSDLDIGDDFGDRDDEDDEYEEAVANCGQVRGMGCMKAGSEECDFDCPFRDAMYGVDPGEEPA